MPDPLPILLSESLQKAGFAHGFSTRQGGVSEPPFESLDFAILREPNALRENQRRLAERVGFDPERLYQTKQVHGRTVLRADGAKATMLGYEADALIADPSSGAAVAVRVADCVPILIADPGTGRVAAVHAGWRGVVADVVGATVRHLGARESGSSTPREAGAFVAAIGPCIGACCFEVSDEVAASIARTTAESAITRRDENGKCFVDLRSAVRTQLRALGLSDTRIDDVPGRGRSACTKCEASLFYSYRRDGDASGRLLAAIVAR